jgi:integrase
MRGHIRQRSPGHWAIVLDLRDETGNRRRKWHSFAGTKREAQIECSRLIAELTGGGYVEPDRTTLAVFLDRWLEHVKTQVSPRTHERYAEIARKNIAPLLGAVVLSKLQPAQISSAYAKALTSGHRKRAGGLSPRTVHHMHRILRQALQQAVIWTVLARNPAAAVKPPKVERGTLQTYDLDQTADLLEALRGTRMFMPAALAALCGLRRGELAALRWRDIKLDRAEIAIMQSLEQTKSEIRLKETKSGRSRTVALSETMVDELKAHRVAQAQELLRCGIRISDDTFVVAQVDGSPLQPRSITHEWMRLIKLTALPRIRFHDLRHTHATHLLEAGVHPKVASERLGHSKVGITLDLYSHVLPGMQADAASRVDAALRAALSKRREKKG